MASRTTEALLAALAQAGAAEQLTAARAAVLVAARRPAPAALCEGLGLGHLAALPDELVTALAELSVVELAELLAQVAVADGRPALSRGPRRARGAYYTPASLVEHVLDRALEGAPRGLLLDPACGAGRFLCAALARGVPAAVLRGVDCDPVAVLAARLALFEAGVSAAESVAAVHLADGLLDPLPSDGEYAVAVGNPPWGVRLDPAARERLERLLGPQRGELCSAALFLRRTHQRLAPNGRLAMILPESWLSTRRAEPLRRWLLDTGRLCELELYRKGVFASAPDLVPTVVVLGSSPSITVRRFGLRRPLSELGSGWEAELRAAPADWAAEPHAAFAVGCEADLQDLWRRLAALPRLSELVSIGDGVYRTRLAALLEGGARPAMMHASCVRRHRLLPGPDGLSDAAFARLPAPEQARQAAPKLLCHALRKPSLPDRIVAAVDAEGRCVASNNFVLLLPRAGCPWPLHALAAWLNSRLANRWFADRFVQVNIEAFALGSLPVPPADDAALAELDRLGRTASAGSDCNAEIERLLDRLCGVTAAERAAIDRRWDAAGEAAARGQSARRG